GEAGRFFRIAVGVAAERTRDARGIVGVEVIQVGGRRPGEVEGEALFGRKGRTAGDPVLAGLRRVHGGDVQRRAGIDKAVGERLAQGREVFTQIGHPDGRVDAGLEGDVPDGTIDQVDAVDIDVADRRILGEAIRAAEFRVFAQDAVTE